jgi:hypothetical protein
MVFLPLTRAQPAWGQGPTSNALPPDTTEVQNYRFTPQFTAESKASVTSVSLGGEFRHTFEMGRKLRLMTNLGSRKEDFRLQARSNESKRFTNTLYYQLGGGWVVDMSHMDNRTFNRVISVYGGFQDVVLNTLTMGGGIRHASIAPENFRWSARLNGAIADAEKTFKTDKTQGGEVAGGFGYSLLDRWLVVRGRAYVKNLDVTSLSSLEMYDGLYLKEDSVSASAVVHFSDEQKLMFDYSNFNAEEKYADQKRGSLGGQIEGAENLFEERRVHESRVMGFGFASKMLNGFDLQVDAQHSESTTDYAVTESRFSHNVTDFLRSDLSYVLFTGTRFRANLDVTRSLKDLGPTSVSSFNERRRRLDLSLMHAFSDGFSINLSAGTSLLQQFYLRYRDNPRDLDQLDNKVSAQISSRPFEKLSATIYMMFQQMDFINIDKSLSESNRTKTRYDFRPTLTYTMNERITITQTYGLAIEFTDHTFVPTDNFLDRNITFSNDLKVRLTKRLNGRFYYAFTFHDRGSYLPVSDGGERYFTVEREDRRDQIRLDAEYEVNKHLFIVCKQDYNRREDRTPGRPTVNVNEDGGLEVGIRGNYNWSTDRTLALEMRKANRFGSFSTKAQKDYWIVNAQFRYSF